MTSLLFPEPYKFVIDTSALIDMNRHYPRDVFEGAWASLEESVQSREIISAREVRQEIEQGDDYLVGWCKTFKSIFLKPTPEERRIVGNLQKQFPFLVDYNSDRPNADPMVIACAQHYNLLIIQHEKVQNNKQKLPFVAKELGLRWISLPEFFRQKGAKF